MQTAVTLHAGGHGREAVDWAGLAAHVRGQSDVQSTDGVATNENDVWASLDMGATWDLIAGISRNGTRGYVQAVNATRRFSSRGGSNNCEDPTNDDVFSIGGIAYIPGTTTQQRRHQRGVVQHGRHHVARCRRAPHGAPSRPAATSLRATSTTTA